MKGIRNEHEILLESVMSIAGRMIVAARTAPKAKGKNNLFALVVSDEALLNVAEKMDEIGARTNQAFFHRDANNVRNAMAMVILGTKFNPANLAYCGWCGAKDCAGNALLPDTPCSFNSLDLGIATGSAVSVAMDNRIDNRVMYTAGIAAIELGLFDETVKIALGIPLSASSKNIFFDRG